MTKDVSEASMQSFVRWVKTKESSPSGYVTWNLMVRKRTKERCVATVWDTENGSATWHTWNRDGIGGENDVERADTPANAVRKAMIESSASAIFQGFI